jgi:hypothetical protein
MSDVEIRGRADVGGWKGLVGWEDEKTDRTLDARG